MTSPTTSTYGRPALERLRDIVRAAKVDDAMAPVTILLPNNVAGIVARRYLAREGLDDDRTGIAALRLGTLTRLAEQIAAPALIDRRPATGPIVSAAWRAALDDEPGLFADVAAHPATVRALVGAHRELRDLTDNALDTLAQQSTLTVDLIRLHRAVTATLTTRWYDQTDLLRTATDRCAQAETETEAETETTLVLYLPQALTQAEAAFAKALAAEQRLHIVAAMTGDERADGAVRRTLTRLGHATDTDTTTQPTATRVITASDADEEVRCITRDLIATLHDGTPAHRIAVLYAAQVPYARLLHEHLRAADVAVNGPGIRPVHERATVRAYLEILALPEHDLPRADLFRALAEAPIRRPSGDRVPVSRWERLSRSAGVVHGEDWDTRLTAYTAIERAAIAAEQDSDERWQPSIDRSQRNIDDAEALREFVTQLQARLADGAAMATWNDLTTWAGDMFTDLIDPDGTLPPEEQYAAATLLQTLKAVGTIDSFGTPASLPALREALDVELDAALPRVGTFGVGVLVAPVSHAIGLDVDTVYVCGLAEGTFPGRLREDALLPEHARTAAADELTSYRERLDTRHRHLLAAFAAGRQQTVASFPRGDLRRQSQNLPSRWLLPTLRGLSGHPTLAATEWEDLTDDPRQTWLHTSPSYGGGLRTTAVLAHEQEWRVRAVAAGDPLDHDPTLAAAVDLTVARHSRDFTRYDGNLTAATEGLPDYARNDRLVSPTALETYAVCPHAFFVRRLLRIEPVEEPEAVVTISPLDIGSLIHHAVDDLVREGDLPTGGAPWAPKHTTKLHVAAQARAEALTAAGRVGHPALWARERARIWNDLALLLDDDNSWRAARGASVLASELNFGMAGAEPVTVTLPDGGRVLLRGSADKVDRGADGTLYIIDIKTGSIRQFKDLGEDDPVMGGTKLQLPVYAYAARQLIGPPDAPVSAMYWFVRKNRGERVEVPLTPAVEVTYATTLQTIVASIAAGLFPARAPDAPDYGAWRRCEYCNPDGVGHGEARVRWERKRHHPALRTYLSMAEPEALLS
ncbi:hypothetical protein BH20ACT5_BH20ACT5_07570 [soil metagenome]